MDDEEIFTPTPPKRKSSEANGRIGIYFTEALNLPVDFIDQVERRKPLRSLNSTTNSTATDDDADALLLPLIELSVIPGEYSNTDKVEIHSWKVESHDEHTITIKVRYQNPIYIS